MGWVLLIGVLAYALLFFSFKFVGLYSAKIAKNLIDELRDDAQFIIETGTVPSAWSGTHTSGARSPVMQKQMALRKIDKIIRYYQRTNDVGDKETRTTMLEGLRNTKGLWQTQSWEEMMKKTDG